jgi:glycosyltransferase involved in cell wall biosynthesis
VNLKSKKILFIKRGFTRFENNDVDLLSRDFDVTVFEPSIYNLSKIFGEVKKVDLLYYWFPNDYKFLISLIGKLLKKKIVVVGGGQMSTADTKEGRKFAHVKYRYFHRVLGILCLRIADKIIAVSSYEFNGLERYAVKNKIELVYNSIDTKLFAGESKVERDPKLIITVSGLKDTHYHRKGLDIFVKLSHEMPDFKFVLIGKDAGDGTAESIRSQAKNNLTMVGSVTDDELVSWMFKASIYCQFSRQEGCGVALAESMACKCIPVVSRYGAIPEVAGPDAYYIDNEINYSAIRRTIMSASKARLSRDLYSRRIASLFNERVRDKLIVDTVNSVFQSQ